ncbi:MAG: hypothetical protein KDC07_04535, partial [Chitinophagaceae bacterium]|nr:hypothetical protein [Chitinophagaceae bacterium]
MKTTVAVLALSVLICACNKNKAIPVNNTNEPVQVIDSALLFDNISDSVLMGVYDSINIPFIVRTNYEGTRKITLSVSGMPTRLKAELTTSSGTTPLSSTLKLYTHLPVDKPLQGVI